MTTRLLLAAACAAVVLGIAAGAARAGEEKTQPEETARGWEMPYPLAAPGQSDEIFHVPTGIRITPEALGEVLAGMRVVYVGETHDNIHAHRVELAVIREMARRFPGQVAIGMEMFRAPQQETLDRWTRGELAEIDFVREVKWYDTWGMDYGYYRAILDFAKENRIDVVALNPPKELQERVSKEGLDQLPPEVRAQLPEIAELDPYQRESLKAVFGAHKATEGVVESFLRIQALWEETMAARVTDYLAGPRGAGKRMVVLAGGWHVRYGFGIPRKVFRRMPLASAIVLPVELEIPEEKKESQMQVDLPVIPLLPGDFMWMVHYEGLEKDQVRMGVHLAVREGRVLVEKVVEGSPAGKAGVAAGDALRSIDGAAVASIGDVQHLVRAKKFGDRAQVVIERAGVELPLELELFRMAEPPKPPDHPLPLKDHGKPAAEPGEKP